jgi:hypothetical protein
VFPCNLADHAFPFQCPKSLNRENDVHVPVCIGVVIIIVGDREVYEGA